eukprot:PhF_6_TR34999/c0_g1_i1/m.50895
MTSPEMFMISVDGWTVVSDVDAFTQHLHTDYPTLTVDVLDVKLNQNTCVDVLCPATYARPLNTRCVWSGWTLTSRGWYLVASLVLYVVGLVLLNVHITNASVDATQTMTCGYILLILWGLFHLMGHSRARIGWLLQCFETYYMIWNLGVYVFTLLLELSHSGMPVNIVVPLSMVLVLSMAGIFLVDSNVDYPHWYRCCVHCIGMLYYVVCWCLYRLGGSIHRAETKAVLAMDVDLGVFVASLESIRLLPCLSLAVFFCRGVYTFVVRKHEFLILKEVYVRKESAVDIDKKMLFEPPPAFDNAVLISESSNNKDKDKDVDPSDQNNKRPTTPKTPEGDWVVNDVVDTPSVGNPLCVPDAYTKDVVKKSSIPFIAHAVAVRGFTVVRAAQQEVDAFTDRLGKAFPFLSINKVEIEDDVSYEVFVPSIAVTLFETKALIKGLDNVWARKGVFYPFYLLAFGAGLFGSAPSLGERVGISRETVLYVCTVLTFLVQLTLCCAQTKHRIPTVFKSFESFFIMSNVILFEFTFLWVWYKVYPVQFMVLRLFLTVPLKCIAYVGLDATRTFHRSLKAFTMLSLSLSMVLTWLGHRFPKDVLYDPVMMGITLNVVDVGFYSATISTLRMIASSSLAL